MTTPKEYGVPDTDTIVFDKLKEYCKDRSVKYYMHHQRMPVDARPCLYPRSLRAQAVLTNGQVVTAFQAAPDRSIRISIT